MDKATVQELLMAYKDAKFQQEQYQLSKSAANNNADREMFTSLEKKAALLKSAIRLELKKRGVLC